MMKYTQHNDGIVWFFAAFLTFVLLLVWFSGPMGSTLFTPLLLTLLLVGLLELVMSRLTVTVTGETLSIWLGPGLMKRQCNTTEIVDVNEVSAPSPFAVGLRWLGDGWLYSLGSPTCTQVRFMDGSRLVIATEPENDLATEIRQRLRR